MREHATMIQKNRRFDSIVSIFNFTEPARRFCNTICPRLKLRGPSNAAPILSHDDISTDLGGDGPGTSSARRTIAHGSRRTARHHLRDRAQQAQIHLSQDRNAPAGRAGAAALPLVSRTGWTQAYPNKPMRIVAPSPPGGTIDQWTRIIGQWLSD